MPFIPWFEKDYGYDFDVSTAQILCSKADGRGTCGAQSMDWSRALGLLVQGSSSNWWGLGCPAHCSGSLLILGLTFGFGASFGFLGALFLFRAALLAPAAQTVFTSEPAAEVVQPSRPASLRLRGYLHEQAVAR